MRIYLELEGGADGRLPECPDSCYGGHPITLWLIERQVQPWGHFATAVINRRREVIDSSLPHTVNQIPKDARELNAAEVARLWHEDNESHVFGGPNVAKALRAAIAEHNASVRP